ncbi:Fanconi anemia group F protein [Heptranchias perlo]|uniref:Fanconi anemia group F protein n=1 Tax=Heptranchias perlo TaxID=212740 RepID=UPI00355AA1D1
MEAVVGNLARFAEVLAVARSPWAGDWDEAAVSRAFQWARYFEQLNRRLEGEAGAQAVLQRQLRLLEQRFCRGPGHPLPQYRSLRFEELGRGEEMLREALLCNPAASAAAFHRAAKSYRAANSSGGGGLGPAIPPSLGRAVRVKAAARLLLQAWSRDTGCRVNPPEHPAVSETKAEMLRQRLEELPEQAACEEVLQQTVSGDGGGGDVGSFLPVAALLTDGAGGEGVRTAALRWLLGDGRVLGAFCRALPCSLLTRVASQQQQQQPPSLSSTSFGREYLHFLTDWAGGMRYDASSGKWTHDEGSPEQDWERLLEHLGALLRGPPPVKEAAERTLNSLKTMDGDFDVWGISIWTDLLLALKT